VRWIGAVQALTGEPGDLLWCEGVFCRRQVWMNGRASVVEPFSSCFDGGRVHGVAGEDGCGKGLLLNVLGLLEPPDGGEVTVAGHRIAGLASGELTRLRNQMFGFLFSQPALLASFTVIENVAMPLFRIRGEDPSIARERSLEVLEFCGVAGLCDCLAGRLGPRESSRAALARALVHGPRILVGISPRLEDEILPLARRAAEELGVCVLWAGGAAGLERFAHRIIHFDRGRVSGDIVIQ